MLVLSNSLPKSGSTLFRNYTTALVALRHGPRGQQALRDLARSGRIALVGGFLPRPDGPALDDLARASRSCPIVVKVHAQPTQAIRDRLGPACRVTYCIRDPRDVFVSARDHAQRTRNETQPMFDAFLSEDAGIAALRRMLDAAVEWLDAGLLLLVRYEDLVPAPGRELRRLASWLGIEASPDEIDAIVRAERQSRRPGQHNLNTGELNRYRSMMNPALRRRIETELGGQIRALGYPIS